MSEIGEKMITTCGHCGEVRECQFSQCPFMLEINPEDKDLESEAPTWWCESCYSMRCDEI